jgi:hypothetical protein
MLKKYKLFVMQLKHSVDFDVFLYKCFLFRILLIRMRIKKISIVFSIIWLLFFWWLYAITDTSEITLKIQWIWVRHGTPNNLNLTATWNASQDQEITWQFGNYFWIEDLLWLSTWHYVTIQCNGLHWPAGHIITWIYLEAWNVNPTKILWNNWNVFISSNLSSYQSIYNPIVYIYKSTNNSNIWLVNKYGDIPIFKVVVPANTTAWTYNGTIIFTLYTN